MKAKAKIIAVEFRGVRTVLGDEIVVGVVIVERNLADSRGRRSPVVMVVVVRHEARSGWCGGVLTSPPKMEISRHLAC